jgi:hypothetical protein
MHLKKKALPLKKGVAAFFFAAGGFAFAFAFAFAFPTSWSSEGIGAARIV